MAAPNDLQEVSCAMHYSISNNDHITSAQGCTTINESCCNNVLNKWIMLANANIMNDLCSIKKNLVYLLFYNMPLCS